MAVKVGSFAKSTAGAPVSQAITGVGFTPRAIIMWTANQTSGDSFSLNGYLAMGFSDGTDDYSVSSSIQDNVTPPNTGRRHSATVINMAEYDGSTTLYECELTSFDADGFTVNWTTNDANAVIIHYMALGGPNFTNAKVLTWTCPTSTGNKAVTGVGFQPDCVLHLSINTTGAPPVTGAVCRLSVGAMTSGGQWGGGITEQDNANPNRAYRTFNDSRTLQQLSVTGLDNYATYVSMDADGFTVNFGDAAFGATYVGSLCLKGGSYYVNREDTIVTSVGDQAFTGVGFQPEGVMVINGGTDDSTGVISDISFSISATDGTANETAFIESEDLSSGTPDNAASYDSSTKIILHDVTQNQSLETAASIVSLDADGFTINKSVASYGPYPYVFAFNGGAVPQGQPTALRDWVKHTGRPWRPQRGL